MNAYRFHCWEQQDPTFFASLLANCTRTGRLGYFECVTDLTYDITSMAITNFATVEEKDPLIAIALASQAKMKHLYATVSDLTAIITASNKQPLIHLLAATTAAFPKRLLA